MATQFTDSQLNVFDQLDSVGGIALNDTRQTNFNLTTLNAEVVMPCQNTNSASIDVRGAGPGTLVVEYQSNGTDYISAPIFNPLTESFTTTITVAGFYVAHLPSGAKAVRVRMSGVGTAAVALRGSEGDNFVYAKPIPSTTAVTVLTVANTAGTLTLPVPGIGLYHYITSIKIKRINNSASAIAGTALLAITTTNLSGSLGFSSGNALAVGEDKIDEDLNFTGNPLKSSAPNTASTIVMPAGGLGVQYRATVTYYVGA